MTVPDERIATLLKDISLFNQGRFELVQPLRER